MSNTINAQISFSPTYMELDALIAAGATIDEIHKWYEGEYPRRLIAFIVTWYKYNRLIKAHFADAEAKELKRKSKNK